jgi:50S ribosomal protein L16 3-hydroxylase
MGMIFQQLLGSFPARRFFEEYFYKLPYSSPGGCSHLAALGSWDVIAELLSRGDSDLLVARDSRRWDGPAPTTLEAGRDAVAQGYTLGFRHTQRQHPKLAELAQQLREEFAAPVEIHLYCTPEGQPGFGWHYDAEEVFILQTAGAKSWSLRKNTVNPWPLIETLPRDMRYEREIMPLVRCDLAAGDWLYIPSGYWHSTQAGEESISLSIGIEAPTAIHLLDALRAELLDSLRWRQRLPVLGAAGELSPADLLVRYRAIADDLADDLSKLLKNNATLARLVERLRRRELAPPGEREAGHH